MKRLGPLFIFLLVAVVVGGLMVAGRELRMEHTARLQAESQATKVIKEATGQDPISLKIFNCDEGVGPTACAGRPYVVIAVVPNEDKTAVSEVRIWAGGPLGAMFPADVGK